MANLFHITAGLPVARDSGQTPASGHNTAYITAGLAPAAVQPGTISKPGASKVKATFVSGVSRHAAPVARGLVAAYPFTGGSLAQLAEVSSHKNAATIYGSPTWVPGPLGNGLLLDSAGESCKSPLIPAITNLPTKGPFSIVAWIRSTATALHSEAITTAIAGTYNSSGYTPYGWMLFWKKLQYNHPFLQLEVRYSTSPLVIATAGGTAPWNVDTMVCAVFHSPSSASFYIDGKAVAATASNIGGGNYLSDASGESPGLRIGASYYRGDGSQFIGRFDQVLLFDRALSLQDVTLLNLDPIAWRRPVSTLPILSAALPLDDTPAETVSVEASADASALDTQASVESVLVQADSTGSATDAWVAQDVPTVAADAVASAVQTAAFTETVLVQADAIASAADVRGLGETTGVVADAVASASETLVAADVVVATATAEAIQSDMAAFVEAVAASADAAAGASDNPDLSEIGSAEAQAVGSAVDAMQGTESVLCEGAAVSLAVDAAIFAEAASVQAGAECSVLDSTAPSEVVGSEATSAASAADVMQGAEPVLCEAAVVPLVVDRAAFADVVAAQATAEGSGLDSTATSEVVSCEAAGAALAADRLAGVEAVTAAIEAQSFAVETAAYGEIIAAECFAVTTAADLGLFTESVLVQADTVGSAFDTIPAGGALIQTFLLIQKTR